MAGVKYIILESRGNLPRPHGYDEVVLLNMPEEGVVIPWKPNYSVKEAILRWAQEEMVKEVG